MPSSTPRKATDFQNLLLTDDENNIFQAQSSSQKILDQLAQNLPAGVQTTTGASQLVEVAKGFGNETSTEGTENAIYWGTGLGLLAAVYGGVKLYFWCSKRRSEQTPLLGSQSDSADVGVTSDTQLAGASQSNSSACCCNR
jgi:hypothetical protein